MNPVLDAVLGGWELNAINTANTGMPVNVYYAPSAANDVTGLATNAEYRGTAILRPNVSGSACGPEHGAESADLLCRAALSPPHRLIAPFGNLGRNAFRAPGSGAMGSGGQQELQHHGRHQSTVPQRVL